MTNNTRSSGPVDVLAVMRNAVAWMPNAVYAQEMREAISAVSTLIKANEPADIGPALDWSARGATQDDPLNACNGE